jgi:hypothetical protein
MPQFWLTWSGSSKKMRRLLFQEGFPSGQRGQTVNLLAPPSEVRILPPPPLGIRALKLMILFMI